MQHRSSAPVVTDLDDKRERPIGTDPVGGPPKASVPASPQHLPVPTAREVSSTYLTPADLFPTTLAELELGELHVLHSRIVRQLDREYRSDPAGPHPVTLDRAHELVTEIDTRQEFLGPPAPVPAPIGAPTSSRGSDPTSEAASPARSAPAPRMNTAGTRSRQRPSTAPRRPDERTRDLFPFRDDALRTVDVRIHDVERLWPGDHIEIWQHERLQWVGIVEQAAPGLGVVWVRDALDGYRRMLHLHDTVLRYHLRAEPRRPAS